MRNILTAVLLLILSVRMLVAQEEVLFTMDGIPVTVEAFERTYSKNSDIPGADIPVDDYLERYINFRLKVLEAERSGYDTLQSFMEELEGYRDQLAAPYLQDKQAIDSLVREAYDRTVNEVNVSQILLLFPDDPLPEDTLRAFQKAMDVRNRLIEGEPFEKLAVEFSDDPSVESNHGNVGWFSAFTMVFPFEDAAYKARVGDISMPVRTSYGYHIIRVNGKREALGEILLAHIMVRTNTDEGEVGSNAALKQIEDCVDRINLGEAFGEVARQFSEDASTAANNGRMRWIRSGELPSDIEQVVFALRDSGSITPPLHSVYGWHVFQLIDRRPLGTFQELEPLIREKVLSDDRIRIADQAFISHLKEQSGFVEYPSNLAYLADMMDSTVYDGRWNPDVAGGLIEPVFAIGDRETLLGDVAMKVAAVKQYPRNQSMKDIVRQTCDQMIRNALLDYKKSRLEEDYPEFGDLIQEYHDGILLFNISNDRVWQQAVLDTTGLQAFYEQHSYDYIRPGQAVVEAYTLQNGTFLDEMKKQLKKGMRKDMPAGEILRAVFGEDTANVKVEQEIYEQGEEALPEGLKWKKGSLYVARLDSGYLIYALRSILPPAPASLSAFKGTVMADYQDYLDDQWIAELRQKYPVLVRPEGLEKIHQFAGEGMGRN